MADKSYVLTDNLSSEFSLDVLSKKIRLSVSSDTGNAIIKGTDGKLYSPTYSVTSSDGSVSVATSGTGPVVFDLTNVSASKVVATVSNNSGTPLAKGTVVYLSGVHGNKPIAIPAQANMESTSSKTFGVVQAIIGGNQDGVVVVAGTLTGLDTLQYSEGSALWLSPTTAGQFTDVKPSAPNHAVYVGFVTRAHQNQGSIEVRIQNGYELEELHNVAVMDAETGDTIVKDASGLWVPAVRIAPSFETVSKNLASSNYDFVRDPVSNKLTSLVYENGVTKTLAWNSSGRLASVTLSGSTPLGIDLVKTPTYNGTGDIIRFEYS